MRINQEGLALIKSFEGCRLKAYKDAVGIWTIGYGHTGGIHEGMVIDQSEADRLLESDLRKFENHVNDIARQYNYLFNDNQFSALVSFAFNVGSINQLTAYGKRNTKEISDAMVLYCKAGGKELAGLKRRRLAEQNLFNKDFEYVKGATYTLYANMTVRTAPKLSAPPVEYEGMTNNAKFYALDNNPILKKYTKVTCKNIAYDASGNVWIQCPSGWICARKGGKTYIC